MSCYRDDLEATRSRVAALEAELAARSSELEYLRTRAVASRGASLRVWAGAFVAAACAVVGALYFVGGTYHQARVHELERRIGDEQAIAGQAREDRRLAFEMLAQWAEHDRSGVGDAAEELSGEDPYVDAAAMLAADTAQEPRAVVEVVSDRPAMVTVDGTSAHRWTPVTLRLDPGQHEVSVSSEGEVHKSIVHARQGAPMRVVVRFDDEK